MKTKHSFLKLLIIVLLLSSCSAEDTSMDPVENKTIKIIAFGLMGEEIPQSEGGALEVYGTISTKLVLNNSSDERILWERSSGNWKAIGGEIVVIESETIEQGFTVNEQEIKNGAKIELKAKLWDKDPSGNPSDFLGEETISIQIDSITSFIDDENGLSHILQLKELDGVTFSVIFNVGFISK